MNMKINTFVSPLIGATTYCMIRERECLLIDAVFSEELVEFLAQKEIEEITVLLTHGHYDHILGIHDLKRRFNVTIVCGERGSEVLCNPRKNLTAVANLICSLRGQADDWDITPFSLTADATLKDREIFEWNGINFTVINTPGHSPDSVCYLVKNQCIFVGDTLFRDEEPTLRLPGGSREEYYNYTKPIIESLPGNLLVYPGHGDVFRISEHAFYKGENQSEKNKFD